ncbi:MAG: nitroreductase family protein [Methylococcales bacterium]|nr:nitroreductase family protein [Methylococcales bacterium]
MILENIKNRRSTFPPQFNSDEVSIAEINTLLEAANCAPSHYKSEPSNAPSSLHITFGRPYPKAHSTRAT